MRAIACLAALGVLALVATGWARADMLIGAPDVSPTVVDGSGALQEDWGLARLELQGQSEEAAAEQRYDVAPVPTALTTLTAGAVTLTERAYRAPIWPAGVDVIEARAQNTGDEEKVVGLRVLLPEGVDTGNRVAMLGGRAVLALLEDMQPVRKEREWGYASGGVRCRAGGGQQSSAIRLFGTSARGWARCR